MTTNKTLARLKKRLRPEVLYSFSFSLSSAGERMSRPDFTLVEASVENIAALKKAYPRELGDRKRALMLGRVDSEQERCWLIADTAGSSYGYSHVTLSSTVNARINHAVKLSPNQAYFFDDFVFPRHRGKGLHTFSIAERSRILSADGRTEGLVTISRTNKQSLASYGKFGLARRHVLVHVPLLRRTLAIPERAVGPVRRLRSLTTRRPRAR